MKTQEFAHMFLCASHRNQTEQKYMSDLNEMTMRDLLAMYAMQSAFNRFGFAKFDYQELAKVSYAVADAMMQERSTNQRSENE
jgi:hypothetical protein